jgi:hypothetical protein
MWINLPKPYHSPHVSFLVAFKLMYKFVIGLTCIIVSRLSFPILVKNIKKFQLPYIWIIVDMASQKEKSYVDDVQNTGTNHLAHHHLHPFLPQFLY